MAAVNGTKTMDHQIVNAVSIGVSIFSLLFTSCALLICFTQQCWKKRDGILLLNIYVIDMLYSCLLIPLYTCFFRYTTSIAADDSIVGVVLSNLFTFTFLLSWTSQCLIAINRYIVIIFPFTYKEILSRNRLTGCVCVVWSLFLIGCTVACTLTKPPSHDLYRHHIIHYEYHLVFLQLTKETIMVIMALHVALFIVLLGMECYLWKIARGHQSRYRSITNSVSNKEGPAINPTSGDAQHRRLSATKSLQKRLSFSTQRMAVRRTPFLLLGAHFISIVPYVTLGFLEVVKHVRNNLFRTKFYMYTCMFLLIANSLRPIINVFNHLSSNKIRRFKLLLQKYVNKESAELCTEYYIENQKEIQTLFKLRRESAHSLNTEGSVV